MLYVIKLGFEMVNAKFFRSVDRNALTVRVVCYSVWGYFILFILWYHVQKSKVVL